MISNTVIMRGRDYKCKAIKKTFEIKRSATLKISEKI